MGDRSNCNYCGHNPKSDEELADRFQDMEITIGVLRHALEQSMLTLKRASKEYPAEAFIAFGYEKAKAVVKYNAGKRRRKVG